MSELLTDCELSKAYDEMENQNNIQSILQAIVNINNKIDGLCNNIMKLEHKVAKLEKETPENEKIKNVIYDLCLLGEKLQNECAPIKALENIKLKINEIASNQQIELSKTKDETEKRLEIIEHRLNKCFCSDNNSFEQIGAAHLNDDQKINELEKAEIKLKFYHLEKALLQTQNQLTDFFPTDENLYCSPDFTWKLKGLKDKLRHKNFECSSKEFILKFYPFKAQLKFSKNSSDRIDVDISYKNADENGIGNVSSTLYPRIFLILKDRSGNQHPKHVIRSDTLYFNHLKHSMKSFKLIWASKDFMKNPLYNVNNSVTFEIYAEPASVAQRAYSHNGILIDTVKDYQKKKIMEEEMLVKGHLSPYFYTSAQGYRVQIEMYLLGCATNNDQQVLKAYVIFLTSEFDSNLTPLFKHRTKITIFNRNDSTKNLERSVVKHEIPEHSFYKINIALPNEIEDGGFVADDTLYYKVEIEAINN